MSDPSPSPPPNPINSQNLNADFNWLAGYAKKAIVFLFWITYAASLVGNAIQIYSHILLQRAIREAKASDEKHKIEADSARADARLARSQKAVATIVYQTNMVFVAQSESNLARIESDYSGASNSVDAWSVYKRRHSISTDSK